MTKQEVLSAITAKQQQVKTICNEIKALRSQLERIEAAEKTEQARLELQRKQEAEAQAQKLTEQKSLEDMLTAQIEAQKLKDLQRQLIIQADREETQRIIEKLDSRQVLEGALQYEVKVRAGKKTEIYTDGHPDADYKVIVKWDVIEYWMYGKKTTTYKRIGDYWVRNYGNCKFKHSKNLINYFIENRLIFSTLPEKPAKASKSKAK